MTPENRRPHTPATKELHPGIVPVEEGGERPHLEDAPSIQDINTGEIPTLLPDHSGKLVLTNEERSSDEFQQKTDALRAYHQERSTVDAAPSHTARNITLGAASLLLAGGAIAGVTALNNQPSNTPPETEPSATGGPIAGETQAPAPTNTVESPLASPTNLGPLETAKPSASPEIEARYSVAELKAMNVEQFNELPRNERMVLIRHMLEKAQEVSLYYGEDTYKYNPLEVASEKNTAQEIVKQLQFEAHMIFHQGASEQADDTRLDKVAAQKALSGIHYDTSGKTSAYFTMATTTIENAKNTGAVPDRYDNAQEIAPPQTTIDQDGKEVTYRTISFTDQTNMPHTAKVVYTPIGNGKGIWQLYELTRNN